MNARVLWAGALVVLGLATQACGVALGEGGGGGDPADQETGGEPSPAQVSYAQDIQPIWNSACRRCHNPSYPVGNLDLTPAASYGALVRAPSHCNPQQQRVVPGDRQASSLWRALANHPDKCGGAMPYGTQGLLHLDAAAFQKVEAWIDQGALNN